MATSSHSMETGYFPCPAGVNVADHVTLKLCQTNYFEWQHLMVAFLTNQKLIGFVDGTISPMTKPPPPPKESWEEKCFIEVDIPELKRRLDWEQELLQRYSESEQPLLDCLKEWKQEQKGVVEKWEEKRMEEWKAEHKRREENWKSERKRLQEWVQKSREKGKQVLDESQEEVWQESDEEEKHRAEEQQQKWEKEQKLVLDKEQKRRDEWKRKWDDEWDEKCEELWKELDLEARARNEWHRELERQQEESWWRHNEWERLVFQEENRKYMDWKRSDRLVLGWLQARVTEEMLEQLTRLETARKAWIKLEKTVIAPFSVQSGTELIDWTDRSTADNIRKYMELHKATLKAEWKAVERFLGKERYAIFQPITWCLETALMVAIRSDRQNNFVKELIFRMVFDRPMALMKQRMQWMERNTEEIMLGMEGIRRMETMLQEMMERMKQRLECMERMERGMIGTERMERGMIAMKMMEQEMTNWIYEEMTKIQETTGMMFVLYNFSRQSVPLLGETDISGATALHAAVERDNMELAELLNDKNPQLVNIGDRYGTLAVHVAARLGNKKMVEFLRPLTTNLCENDQSGLKLLHFLASSGLYDIALTFLRENPRLASKKPSLLAAIAQNRTSFCSGTNLNFFKRLIYSVIHLQVEDSANRHQGGEIELREISTRPQVEVTANGPQEGDIENPAKCKCCKCADHPQEQENPARCMNYCCESVVSALMKVWQKLKAVLFSVVAKIPAPQQYINIKETKLTNHQAHELVKCLCNKIVETDFRDVAETDFQNAAELFTEPLMHATCTGIHEIIAEILDSFPGAIHIRSKTDQSLFHLAIVYRQESIFNLTYPMEDANLRMFLSKTDESRNNGLHLAGKLTEEQQLSLRANVAGAAQQMQREIRWFKEVKKFVLRADRELRNIKGKTPQEVFTDTHKDLVKEGEKWMKDTATSCSIVAALITTIVFAAAITIPGSYNNNSGLPFFLGNGAFTLFSVSNALAMLSSSVSLLVFLSVLTCRYAEQDFLYSLPRRMIIGQVTLFFSIISIMFAFGATLKVLSGDMTERIIILVGLLCCVPITIFAVLQSPLCYDMIKSTYFSGIFKKQSNCRRLLT